MNRRAYYNGSIISMVDDAPEYSVLVENDGVIEYIGYQEELDLSNFEGECIDLEGKTMLPGFIDSHGHIIVYAEYRLYADISIDNGVDSISKLKDVLKDALAQGALMESKDGSWLVGNGYDNAYFEDGRHPNKFDLDEISTEIPIVCFHISGHVGATNSKGLELLGYFDGCENPERGVLQRLADGSSLNGVLEGGAFYNDNVVEKFGKPTYQQMVDSLIEIEKAYAAYGITSTTEASLTPEQYDFIEYMHNENKDSLLDLVIYPYIHFSEKCKYLDEKQPSSYINNMRFGGVKILLDGSPQAKTAWLSKPYYVIPDKKPEDYAGYPLWKDEQVEAYFEKCIENDWSIHVHCNGDAASEQFIRNYEKAMNCKSGYNYQMLRPTMIHCQTVRQDQIERMRDLGILASVFVDHVYYWGDWHYQSVLGPERASRISPLRSIVDAGIPYTLHQDAPICKPNMILSLHNAVNRTTKGGMVLGENEKITVWEALKGITINGAYQFFEENTKGTLEVGKKADLVVLDSNPLTVDVKTLKDIKVLATYKNGKKIFDINQ